LESLLAIVGLEVTTEDIAGLGHVRKAGWGELQMLGSATLKLQAPNKGETNKNK